MSSTFSAPCSSSPRRLKLLLCLLILLQLLINANAALLLPLDSTLFSPHNCPYSSYRRTLFPNVAFASSPISGEFESADNKRQTQPLEQSDLSKKRAFHVVTPMVDKNKLNKKGLIEVDPFTFTPLQLAPAAITTDGQSLTSSADQLNTLQCFCCRAFACRKQICPCSKFLI